MATAVTLREAFGRRLAEQALAHPELVVLDADLAACTYGYLFGDVCPDRYFNLGIAEANMISLAAGMATTGRNVFACSFAMFTAGRAFEQIRNACAYPHLNVKVVGTYAGITVGEDGATHQCIEDLALMRSIPGMVVLNPADANEATKMVDALLQYDGPAYIRLPRDATLDCTSTAAGYHFDIGKVSMLTEGMDVTLAATGIMVEEALKAQKLLAKDGISARVLDVHTIKPLDAEVITAAAEETGAIVAAEEHNILGGLGGAIAELLSQEKPTPVIRVGIRDKFGKSGEARSLMNEYNITYNDIMYAAQKAMEMKKRG